MTIRLVSLWGDELEELDEVASAALDGGGAIALSRGRFPKSYPHLDANEDAVLAAVGTGARLVAVVDGHSGFDAARAALRTVADAAEGLLAEPAGGAVDALEDVCRWALHAVTDAVGSASRERADSRTALTLALVNGGRLHVATYGDTACLRLRAGKAKPVGGPHEFLGPGAPPPRLDEVRLRVTDAVLVASDGLVDFLGRSWSSRAADVVARAADPLAAARELVEVAMTGGAGDHVAVGLLG